MIARRRTSQPRTGITNRITIGHARGTHVKETALCGLAPRSSVADSYCRQGATTTSTAHATTTFRSSAAMSYATSATCVRLPVDAYYEDLALVIEFLAPQLLVIGLPWIELVTP